MTYTQDQIYAMRNVYRNWEEFEIFADLSMLPLLNPWVLSTESGGVLDLCGWDDDAWSLQVNTVDDILEEVQVLVTFQLPVKSHVEWSAVFIPCIDDSVNDYVLDSVISDDYDSFSCATNFLDPYIAIKPQHGSSKIPFGEFISKLDFLKTIPSDHWPADVLGRGYLNQHYWASLVGRHVKAEELKQSGDKREPFELFTFPERDAWRYSFQAWDPQNRIAKLNKTFMELERKNLNEPPDLNDASTELTFKER